jgi:signal transduction histidine kinase
MLHFLKRRTLFRRLLAVDLVILTLTLTALTTSSYYESFQKESGSLNQELRILAGSLARISSLHQDSGQLAAGAEQLKEIIVEPTEALTARPDEVALQVWDREGNLLYSSPDIPSMPKQKPLQENHNRRQVFPGWITMARPSPDGKYIGVIGFSSKYLARMNSAVLSEVFSTLLIAALIATLALWLAVRYGLRPLNDIALLVDKKKHDDFSPLMPKREYIEMKPVVAALNDKMQRLGNMLETERTFFADAAHELRTPLAVLGAQAHLVANEKDAGLRAEALAELEAGVERSARVLNKLLTMAKYHGPENRAALTETDLVALVSEVVAEHAPRAIELKQELVLDAPARVYSLCDAMAIRIAVENLVDNAIRYSPQGGQILVRLEEKSDRIFIAVADEGPGIAVADRTKIFERFERLDACPTTGSGLGLAIVKRIVELHNGIITVTQSLSLCGAQFEITLPRKLFDQVSPASSGHPTS